ncbi:putative amidoligase enzyme-domain-containing protein [Xylaria sp. FL0064]|nr:putative amidoligase enzyme-domain-containing protein [Xylaria sp. FL0064]
MGSIPKLEGWIEAEDDTTETLTCGVELEFLIASIHRNEKDPDPDITDKELYRTLRSEPEYRVHQEVHANLLKALRQLEGVPFRYASNDHLSIYSDMVYDSWRLGLDGSVEMRYDECPSDIFDKGPYTWTCCELSSAVMDANNYAKTIEDVCRVLNTVRTHLNETTAVHVHVGRRNEPFSLLTVKKFATLYWLTEEAIMKLHHPSRFTHRYCPRLTRTSVLAIESPKIVDAIRPAFGERHEMIKDYVPVDKLTRLLQEQLKAIWDCDNMEEVAGFMRISEETKAQVSGFRGSVGFQRFVATSYSGNIQTFEWRQMSGSLNANHINRWVEFCLKFTDFCRLSDKVTFKNFVGNVIERGDDYTGIELLEALNVDTQIFKNMKEVWNRDPHFCNDLKGRELFFSD